MSDPALVSVADDARKSFDSATFARAMTDMGVALELSVLKGLARTHGVWAELVAGRLIELVYTALHGEHGYAFAADYGATMLVGRTADRVVIGAQPGTTVRQPFPPRGWPIARWSKTNPAKNVALVAQWMSAATSHVIAAPRVATAEAPAATAGDRARGEALFAALVADPTDAAVRAVYADWLIERGDLRGEIMRLHAEGKVDEANRRAYDARSVLLQHDPIVRHADLRGGLLESAEVVADDLAKHGAALFARHPVHELTLVVTKPAQLAKLARATDVPLERIRELTISARPARNNTGVLHAIGPSALRATRVFANLRALRLDDIGDDLAEWQRFLGDLEAPHLHTLGLGQVASPPIARFACAPSTLPGIRSLSLQLRRLQDDSDAMTIARPVAAREQLAALHLDTWFAKESVRFAIACELVRSRSLVELGWWPIGDRVARMLARGRFETLAIGGELSTATLVALVEQLPLRALDLTLRDGVNKAAVDEAFVCALESAPARLATVRLDAAVTAAQAARIAATRTFDHHQSS